MEQQQKEALAKNRRNHNNNMPHEDGGRVYNAWAHLEVQDRKFDQARRILAKGMERYPEDPMVRLLFSAVSMLFAVVCNRVC